MLNVLFDVNDYATPELDLLLRLCDPHRVATYVAPKIGHEWRRILNALPRNRNSYPSTGFWQAAARSVKSVALGPNAVITADKLGLRQRWQGGTIAAKNVANLTIPICKEAYGTSVADWGQENLVLVILADGRKFLALWLGWTAAQNAYRKRLGNVNWNTATGTVGRIGKLRADLAETPSNRKKPDVIMFKQKTSAAISRASAQANLKFLFVLKPSVEQGANPAVLPVSLFEYAFDKVKEAADKFSQ